MFLLVLKRDQSQRVRLHIDAIALDHADGRVVVVSVPSRPIGTPIEYKGAYWMRRGADLVAMSAEVLGTIFDESQATTRRGSVPRRRSPISMRPPSRQVIAYGDAPVDADK